VLANGPLRTRRPRSIARGGAIASVVPVLGIALALVIGAPGAPVAEAKKGEAKAPPGLAKKLLPAAVPQPQPLAPAQVPAPGDTTKAVKPQQATKAVKAVKAGKAGKAGKAEPPRPTAPSKAPDPQPVEQPPPSEPSIPSPAPAPAPAAAAAAAAPTVVAPTQPLVPAGAPPEASASEQQRLGSSDRRRGRRASFTGATSASPARTGSDASGSPGSTRNGASGTPTADDESSRPDSGDERPDPEQESSPVIRTVRDIVEVVPDSVKLALAALAALSLVLAVAYLLSALRVRSLARQRGELLSDVGLLQSALLPPVPDRVGALETSVAYRPADGLGAGGDFYDVLPLSGGRAGFILGDVSGHGRDALERTAFLRYTLRAYLEAGLEPRVALQVAGRVIGDGLGGDFATVLLAVHDPRRGSLTYASAGHPAPIVTGGPAFEPVLAGSSPPIGAGVRTGLRQTTLPLTPGVTACLYTDGLIEARTDAGLLGRERLTEILDELGRGATAAAVIERVANEARSASDDMAVCLLSPTATVTSGGFRTEQLELSAEEAEGPLPGRFLEECGVEEEAREDLERELRDVAERFDGAVLHATFGSRRTVEVLPRNVASIEAASRHALAV
jgi:outer membrane biosynthesis protein TonB